MYVGNYMYKSSQCTWLPIYIYALIHPFTDYSLYKDAYTHILPLLCVHSLTHSLTKTRTRTHQTHLWCTRGDKCVLNHEFVRLSFFCFSPLLRERAKRGKSGWVFSTHSKSTHTHHLKSVLNRELVIKQRFIILGALSLFMVTERGARVWHRSRVATSTVGHGRHQDESQSMDGNYCPHPFPAHGRNDKSKHNAVDNLSQKSMIFFQLGYIMKT